MHILPIEITPCDVYSECIKLHFPKKDGIEISSLEALAFLKVNDLLRLDRNHYFFIRKDTKVLIAKYIIDYLVKEDNAFINKDGFLKKRNIDYVVKRAKKTWFKETEELTVKCRNCFELFKDKVQEIRSRNKLCVTCYQREIKREKQLRVPKEEPLIELEKEIEIRCQSCGKMFKVPFSKRYKTFVCNSKCREIVALKNRNIEYEKKEREKKRFYKDLAVINRELSVVNIRVYGQGRYERINYVGDINKSKKRTKKSKGSILKKLIGSTIKYYLKESNEEHQGMITDFNEEENQICFNAYLWLNMDDVFINKDLLK